MPCSNDPHVLRTIEHRLPVEDFNLVIARICVLAVRMGRLCLQCGPAWIRRQWSSADLGAGTGSTEFRNDD